MHQVQFWLETLRQGIRLFVFVLMVYTTLDCRQTHRTTLQAQEQTQFCLAMEPLVVQRHH